MQDRVGPKRGRIVKLREMLYHYGIVLNGIDKLAFGGSNKMGDPTKFLSLAEYYIFNISLTMLILFEFVIMLFTLKGNKSSTKKRSDNGTIFLVFLAFYGSIFLAIIFRGHQITGAIKEWVLPYSFYYIGIAMILLGIGIRGIAILTLKRAFTLSVQTTEEQHLIQNGLYKIVRNPAYTGSIISLLGVAFAYRHILSTICVILLCFICYGARIKIEEKALEKQFQQEFKSYCLHTKYRLFPGIF